MVNFHDLIAHFFLLLNNISLYKYNIVVCSFLEGYLDCFQVLTIMNKATLDIRAQVFVWKYVWKSVG